MFNIIYIIKICLFIILELSLLKGQEECPQNEMPADCEDTCNRCDNDGRQMCPAVCIPGCRCLPGYTRDRDLNCIPRQFCPGYQNPEDRTSIEVRRILDWEDNGKGCPDESICRSSCKRNFPSYTDGLCTGPNRKHCMCFNCRAVPLPLPGRNPPPRGSCPILQDCINTCKQKDHKGGYCTGENRQKCECIANSPTRADDLALLPSNTVRGGCPSTLRCNLFCTSRGLSYGICLGPKGEYCNCFSRSRDGGGRRGSSTDIVTPKPPVSKPDPGSGSECPDLGKCVTNCIKKGKIAGYCSGEGRRTCNCV